MLKTPSTVMTIHRINQDALEAEIAKHHGLAKSADYRTRSELQLEEAEESRQKHERERTEVRGEIVRTRANIVALEAYLQQLEANDTDINIALAGDLALIAALRGAGVALPETIDQAPREEDRRTGAGA
jgi:hypothetical protein